MKHAELKELLDSLVDKYNRIDFIENDPILIPHQYSKKQDIEIAAFIAAIFSWGQRVTIINKSKEFLSYMDNDPYQFILHHKESDLKPFLNFKHRTFNDTDALYFMSFFKMHYSKYDSLEDAFGTLDTGQRILDTGQKTLDTGQKILDTGQKTLDTGQRIMDTGQKTLDTGHWTKDTGQKTKDMGQRKLDKGQKTLDTGQKTLDMGQRLVAFRNYFFSMEDYPERTKKHVSSPANNATCKRINMFLRWMVRKDKQGVDFGIWNSIKPSELICPIDVHVANTANQFGLLKQEKINWNTAVALTETLKSFDAKDPVKYDFALFGLGVSNH
jgi:uncharacterized protein (TIGR02757 family)